MFALRAICTYRTTIIIRNRRDDYIHLKHQMIFSYIGGREVLGDTQDIASVPYIRCALFAKSLKVERFSHNNPLMPERQQFLIPN